MIVGGLAVPKGTRRSPAARWVGLERAKEEVLS